MLTSSRDTRRKYKTPHFAADVLYILRDELRISSWRSNLLAVSDVRIHKVSGSLTNAVFFVSYDTRGGGAHPRTILLRIYGPSSSALISRPDELRTLHMLSSVYKIGPRVFGTFGNGRVEEFFESSALTADDMRDSQTSRWIARRMRELHRADIPVVSGEEWASEDKIAVKLNIADWLTPAVEVLTDLAESLAIPIDEKHPWYRVAEDIDLPRFTKEWAAYVSWAEQWESQNGKSRRVFAHNDAQYGNLLRLAHPPHGKPNHHAIIVVDFEYAAPNPAAYDIANHFHEWTADYHSATAPHLLNPEKYPTKEERRNFYLAYLSPATPSSSTSTSELALPEAPAVPDVSEEDVELLEKQVVAWSPASLAQWTIWGLVQAHDDILAGSVGEFDYLNYSRGRVQAFRAALKELGIAV